MNRKDENFEKHLQQNISVFNNISLSEDKKRQMAKAIIEGQKRVCLKKKPFYATAAFKKTLSAAACLVVALSLVMAFTLWENNNALIDDNTNYNGNITVNTQETVSGKSESSPGYTSVSYENSEEDIIEISEECEATEEDQYEEPQDNGPDGDYYTGIIENGQLYAYELNDNILAKYLTDIYTNTPSSVYPLGIINRAEVRVVSGGNPVSNAEVYGIDRTGNTVAVARTNANGYAYLYSGLFEEGMNIITTANALGKSVSVINGIAVIETEQDHSNPDTANIMFVFDSSPAMAGEFNYFKSNLGGIMEKVAASTSAGIKLSVSFAYHDESSNFQRNSLSADISKNLEILQKVTGSFYTERDIGKILIESIYNQNWDDNAVKICVLVLSNQITLDENSRPFLKHAIAEAQRLGVHIVPVVAREENPLSKQSSLYRVIAAATGGTTLFVPDLNKISNKAIDNNPVKVERVDEILSKIIIGYINPSN
jgi:hypothetical protein